VLYLLCFGMLMIVLDTTIVTVALPTILTELQISGAAVTWMMNAYMLSYGGCLILSGRLGDRYGCRRVFLTGIALFTLASLVCGLAHTQTVLLLARGAQGLGGALVTSVTLALITTLFPEPVKRARAIGVYGFVCCAGGGIGELCGGLVTRTLNWHWIFLVNLPIGAMVYLLCAFLLPRDARSERSLPLDVAGSVTLTAALTLTIYAVVNGNTAGWLSKQTQSVFVLSAILFLAFLGIERWVRYPLVPLRLFRSRDFRMANLMSALWTAGTSVWFVVAALYLQRVLGYDPLSVGLAFVPAECIMAAFSGILSAKLVAHLGIRGPLWFGMVLAAVGLGLFARAPLHGTFAADVLPAMLILGLGVGVGATPLLLTAMNNVHSEESGAASGVVNTSFALGGAIGLALFASFAEMRTSALQRSGADALTALNSGYHLAFWFASLSMATAAILAARVARSCAKRSMLSWRICRKCVPIEPLLRTWHRRWAGRTP
jgi:EmrB/QacA subfamily drug resistance transporter